MGCLFSSVRPNKVEPIGQASDEPELKNDGSIFCTSPEYKEEVQPSTSSGASTEIITEESVLQSLEKKIDAGEDSDKDETSVKHATTITVKSKQQAQQDEQEVLETLRKEGLVQRRTVETSGGLSFELVGFKERPKSAAPPARLEKMKKRSETEILTEDEIREKIKKAERRKKAREEAYILKLRAMEKTETAAVIEAFKQKQKEKEEEHTKKMEEVVEARAQRLRTIRDQMREKDKYGRLVRMRKSYSLGDPLPPIEKREH